MITGEENAKNFKNELSALLKKYDAEIGIDDVGSGYMSKTVIEISLNSQLDKNGNYTRQGVTLTFGDFIDHDIVRRGN